MDVGKGREQERKLFRQTASKFAGNATSRYALGWSYSGLRLIKQTPSIVPFSRQSFNI
jgi:hypothetical protein